MGAFARADAPRFASVAHREPHGVPVLTDSLGWSVCDVVDVREYGDHRLVIGEVLAANAGRGRPLVRHDQRFSHLTPASALRHP